MSSVGKSDETVHTLGMLGVVEKHEALTQRHLARELGVALGLANALVKRCVRKGYIKVREVPAGRFSYYLTPKGFAEKSRLTAEYLTASLSFFRHARTEMADIFNEAHNRNWQHVVFAGAGDLAEIASLAARESGIEPIAVLDSSDNRASIAGMPIVRNIDFVCDFDGIVVTDIRSPQKIFDVLVREFGAERVMAPTLLRISPVAPVFHRDAV